MVGFRARPADEARLARALVRLGAVACLLLASTSFAQAPRGHAVLRFIGPAEERAAFFASLEELLGRAQVALVADDAAAAGAGPVLATVVADWSSAQGCRIEVRDGAGTLKAERRIERDASGVMARETATHVVQSVIDELLEPAADAASRVVAPAVRTEGAPAAASSAPSAVGFSIGAAFSGRLFGGGAPAAWGGGLSLTLNGVVGPVGIGGFVAASYQAPFEVRREQLSLDVQTLSPRAGLFVDVVRQPRWVLFVAFGAGADVLFSSVRSMQLPQSTLTPARTDAVPVLTGLVGAQVAVASTVRVWLHLGVDGDLWPRRYVIEQGADRNEVLSAWRVRPSLQLGVDFTVFGRPRTVEVTP